MIAMSVACGGLVASTPTATAGLPFLSRCASGARPQNELDFAGLPPLAVTGKTVKCLLNASSGGSAYDAGYDASVELSDGRVLHLYERRGGPPAKGGGQTPLRNGTKVASGLTWNWAILQGPTTSLTNTIDGTYVELDLAGDESQLDALAEVATGLKPVESLPRPSAREICATLRISSSPTRVAAAFESTAGAVARWFETPETPGGPYELNSSWRQHPATEPVAICYLDGNFGPAKHPPLPSGATEMPNWTRVVYLVGIDRHPIGKAFGWTDRISIVDPGR